MAQNDVHATMTLIIPTELVGVGDVATVTTASSGVTVTPASTAVNAVAPAAVRVVVANQPAVVAILDDAATVTVECQ